VREVPLSKAQRQTIINSLVSEIGKDPYSMRFSVEEFADAHGLSIQSVYRYLDALEAESIIKKQKNGRENKYHLVDTAYSFRYPIANLAEDVVWKKDIRPLLQGMPEITVRNCNYAFCGILNNAIDHSESAEVEVSVNINAFRVSIQIKDNGIGIFSKIASAMQFEEKRFSILELEKGKFTTEPESHTGEGLFFSAKAVDVFGIFSDGLLFSVNNHLDYQREQIWGFKQPAKPEPGTIVIMEVFRDQSIPLPEILDQYTQESDQYGFTKTIVPVNSLEYGDPHPTYVTRSQAKRLVARLERFGSIELDFSDIDEIGQGFADEVFRVFHIKHPNSQIIATKYNQRVGKMINYVTGADRAD